MLHTGTKIRFKKYVKSASNSANTGKSMSKQAKGYKSTQKFAETCESMWNE
jgi:hypothetical protein